MFNTTNLTPMQLGRLNAALEKRYRFQSAGVLTLRQYIESLPSIEKSECDGMIGWNRRHFNRLGSTADQRAYEDRLKAKRHYFVNGVEVPKLVHDAIVC